MAQQKQLGYFHLTCVFLMTVGLALAWNEKMASYGINWLVVEGANAVLFILTFLNIYFQKKNINNPNQSAVIRGVMAGTFLKLMCLAAAALIYLVVAGEGRNVKGVFVGMGLYVVYTWLEVRISLQMKPKK